MSKASTTVTLVLIGSAASLIGYNALTHHNRPADGTDVAGFGDFGPDGDGPDTQPTTGPAGVVPVRSRTYRSGSTYSSGYHSSGTSSSGYRSTPSGSSSGTYRQPSGGSSGGSSSSSHSSSTSRGGFGSTGHSVSSSSS